MDQRVKCITLWLLLIIFMILHFNYHVGEIFFGIDIVKEDANGTVPTGAHVIRGLFYHLPVIWIFVLMYTKKKWALLGLFVLSIVYTFAHAMHLFGELKKPDISQITLLSLALITSVILTFEHFNYYKSVKG